jgi:hypothetical protein
MKFWLFWGFDGVVALVILYFFVQGLLDGSVSTTNITLWGVLLLLIVSVLGGSIFLRSHGHPIMAALVLFVLALPGLLYGLFFLAVLLLHPRWN